MIYYLIYDINVFIYFFHYLYAISLKSKYILTGNRDRECTKIHCYFLCFKIIITTTQKKMSDVCTYFI